VPRWRHDPLGTETNGRLGASFQGIIDDLRRQHGEDDEPEDDGPEAA